MSKVETINESSNWILFLVDRDFSIQLHVDGCIVIVGIVLLVLLAVITRFWTFSRMKTFEISEAELGVGSQKIKFRPNSVDKQIAFKIWLELSTRKIGLKIDSENDVITEIYDSWYTFFSVTRELIKDLPASKLGKSDTKKLILLLIEVLNKGIRPHLTKWQAKFRKWYENESKNEASMNLSPQEIQKKFPQYDDLMTDLELTNKNLIKYKDKVHEIFRG